MKADIAQDKGDSAERARDNAEDFLDSAEASSDDLETLRSLLLSVTGEEVAANQAASDSRAQYLEAVSLRGDELEKAVAALESKFGEVDTEFALALAAQTDATGLDETEV